MAKQTTYRWRVVLDFGLQHQTVYVHGDNSIAAKNAAETLGGKDRCVAVQWNLSNDQTGPVDVFDPVATADDDGRSIHA